MAKIGGYDFHRLASIAYNQLTEEEKSHVLEKMAALVATPVEQWSTLQAVLWRSDPVLYLVPADDELRFFVELNEGQPPEVRDIFTQARLDAFQKAAANMAS